MKKASQVVKDAKAYAKRQAAAYEERKAQLSEQADTLETR